MQDNPSYLEIVQNEKYVNTKNLIRKVLTEKIKPNSCWFIFITILSAVPGFVIQMQFELFNGVTPSYQIQCKIPQLSKTNWSLEQIKILTQPVERWDGDCLYYNFDYEKIAEMTYEKALKYTSQLKNTTNYIFCENNFIVISIYEKTLAEEFHFGCVNYVNLRLFDLVSVFSGMFLPIIGDIFGRKTLQNWGLYLYYTGGIGMQLAGNIYTFVLSLSFIQAGYLTMFIGIQATIMEIMAPFPRRMAFIISFYGWSLGYLVGPLMEFESIHWRHNQLILSSFILLLPIVLWYIPESPRFFLVKRKYQMAKKVLYTIKNSDQQNELLFLYQNENKEIKKNFKELWKELKKLLQTKQFYLLCLHCLISGFIRSFQLRWVNTAFLRKTEHAVTAMFLGIVSANILCLPILLELGLKCSLYIFILFSGIITFSMPIYDHGCLSLYIFIFMFCLIEYQLHLLTRLYMYELTPTSVRCTSVGLLYAFSITGTHLISGILKIYVSNAAWCMTIGCTSIIGFINLYFMIDLKNESMADYVEELQWFIKLYK